jgi:putative membrane protein
MDRLPPFHLHFDVILILGVVGLGYWWLQTRIRPHWSPGATAATRSQWTSFHVGLGLLAIVSMWPLHDLAEKSLYWVHMVDHMVITLFAPPLLIRGLNRAMADRLFGHRWVRPWLRPLAHPVVAFSIFNLGLISTHWPEAVALSLGNELAHFSIHGFLFASALLMWLPLVSPSTVLPRLAAPLQLVYLFLNSILPIIPASLLTFSNVPVYPAYGDASLAFGLTPVADQTIAGLIMKIGGTLYFWILMAVIWFRWATEEKQWDRIEEELRAVP